MRTMNILFLLFVPIVMSKLEFNRKTKDKEARYITTLAHHLFKKAPSMFIFQNPSYYRFANKIIRNTDSNLASIIFTTDSSFFKNPVLDVAWKYFSSDQINVIMIIKDACELYSVLKQFGKEVPICNAIIWIEEFTIEESKELLKDLWTKNRILEIAIIFEPRGKKSSLTIIYNPYVITDGSTERGDIKIFATSEIVRNFSIYENYCIKRISNFRGYPFHVTMHNTYLLSDVLYDEKKKVVGFKGPEANMVEQYVKQMNVSVNYSLPLDGIVISSYTNKSYSGAIKDIEDGKTDFVGNYHIINNLKLHNSKLLDVLRQSKIVFVVPQAKPHIKSFPQSAITIVKVSLILLTILNPIWIYLKIKAKQLKHPNYKWTLTNWLQSSELSVLSSFGILMNVSMKAPKRHGERIIFATIVIWALFFMNILIGYLIIGLNPRIVNINTLKELAESDFKIAVPIGMENILQYAGPYGKELYDRHYSVHDYYIYNQIAAGEKIAYLDRYETNEAALNYFISEKDGSESMHTIKEPVGWAICAQIIKKRSHLFYPLRQIQKMVVESGLELKWMSDSKWKIRVKIMRKHTSAAGFKPMELHSLILLMTFPFITLLVSVAVLLFEIIYHKFNK